MENDTPSPDELALTHLRTLLEHTHQPEEEEREDTNRFEDSAEPNSWQEYDSDRIRQEADRLKKEIQEIERRQREEHERLLEAEANRWRDLRFQEEQERLAEERLQRQLRLKDEAEEQAKIQFRHRVTSGIIWISLPILISAFISLLFSVIFSDSNFRIVGLLPYELRRISLSLIFILVPIIIASLSSRKSDDSNKQLNSILQEREKITRKIERDTKQDIFYTIQLNLNQLNEYYTINKNQARNSFNFSIGAASAGLVTIFAGIWFYYLKSNNIPATYITSIAGIILEFIGGAYFFIYKKSIEQVNLFFNQLVINQDTMLAIELTKLNRNTRKRSITQERIITSLLQRSQK